jgi:hypothetical protein
MNLQEQYKKETNLEAYELDTLNNGYDNFKYVKWLEAKLTLTDVSQRSELLIAFLTNNIHGNIYFTKEVAIKAVDEYLSNL